VSKPKLQVARQAIPVVPEEPMPSVSPSVFSDEEIRVRAYQIYESRDRNGYHADADWSQAQIELTEMLGGK
jgi:hypothetical protein